MGLHQFLLTAPLPPPLLEEKSPSIKFCMKYASPSLNHEAYFVKNIATTILNRLCIQPSCKSCLIAASTIEIQFSLLPCYKFIFIISPLDSLRIILKRLTFTYFWEENLYFYKIPPNNFVLSIWLHQYYLS